MTIRNVIQKIFENADSFELNDRTELQSNFKDVEITVESEGEIEEEHINCLLNRYLYIKSKKESGWIELSKEELLLLNSIFSLVSDIRLKQREFEYSKKEYKSKLENALEDRDKIVRRNKLLEKTDFTKENINKE